MSSGLVVWTVVLTASIGAAVAFPPAGVVTSLLAPVLALLWTWSKGERAALLAVLPGALLLVALAPDALPVYAASVLAGVVVARALRSGTTVGAAIALGSVPFALWTAGLAISGFDPVSPEFEQRWEQMLGGAQGGTELRESAQAAVAVLRNTWVASEVLWFAGLLALAVMVGRRTGPGRDLPAPRRWKWLDLPDALVGILIAGLALVLIAPGATLRAAGWNLVFLSGVLYALRGVGIEIFWLDRGSVSRGIRALFFVGNIVLFLPVFLVLSAALGLLDTWFDFRRLRNPEGGRHPLSLFHHSSGDDLKE